MPCVCTCMIMFHSWLSVSRPPVQPPQLDCWKANRTNQLPGLCMRGWFVCSSPAFRHRSHSCSHPASELSLQHLVRFEICPGAPAAPLDSGFPPSPLKGAVLVLCSQDPHTCHPLATFSLGWATKASTPCSLGAKPLTLALRRGDRSLRNSSRRANPVTCLTPNSFSPSLRSKQVGLAHGRG